MVRQKRRVSETSIYHVMMRGNEKKLIFKDDKDREKFIEILRLKKEKNNFQLYTYCLMDNHVHLLIKEDGETISQIMKRINVSYAFYFNKKYNRVGHVFQDRFRSEPIENDRHLLAVARYIHNNPVKALITADLKEYRWSSYTTYLQQDRNRNDNFINVDLILDILSENRFLAQKMFIEFSHQKTDDEFLDIKEDFELDYNTKSSLRGLNEVEKYIEDYLRKNELDIEQLKKLHYREDRNRLIRNLKDKSNLSIREIADLLNLSKSMVGDVK